MTYFKDPSRPQKMLENEPTVQVTGAQLGQILSTMQEIGGKVGGLSDAIKYLSAEVKTLTTQVATLEKNYARYDEKYENLIEKVNTFSAELKHVSQATSESKDTANQARSGVIALQTRIQKLEDKCDEHKKNFDGFSNRISGEVNELKKHEYSDHSIKKLVGWLITIGISFGALLVGILALLMQK